MNKKQRELRRTAAKKFKQSLKQLDVMLQLDTSGPKHSRRSNDGETSQSISHLDLPIPAEETPLGYAASAPTVDQIVEELDRYIEANKPE